MDAALADPKGARMRLPEGGAMHFRMRCNHARVIDRRENAHTYEPGHPLHGTSAYDVLRIRSVDFIGYSYTIAERWNLEGTIELLSEAEPIADEPKALGPRTEFKLLPSPSNFKRRL